MSRYQVLRSMGNDPLTSAVISFFNWLRGIPDGKILFMTVVIEYDTKEKKT